MVRFAETRCEKAIDKIRRRPVARRPNPALKAIPEQKRKIWGEKWAKKRETSETIHGPVSLLVKKLGKTLYLPA